MPLQLVVGFSLRIEGMVHMIIVSHCHLALNPISRIIPIISNLHMPIRPTSRNTSEHLTNFKANWSSQ